MDHETDETPPLLMLNDKCLLDIFQLLKLKDFVHFAETCVRLRNVARLNKFKKINVYTTTERGVDTNDMVSKDEFIKIMSLIGEHVLTVHISHGLNDVFEIIRDKCKNLNILDSHKCQEPVEIHDFHNLKQLSLSATSRNLNVLPCFDNDIVSLDLSGLPKDFKSDGERQYFLELLKRLPKIKNLNLGYVRNIYYLHSREFLLHINGLTSFSFKSNVNRNDLLKKLSNLNLVELCFEMELNAATFDILQHFQNLEVIVMVQYSQEITFPETTVLPPKLKHFEIDNIDISWSKFSSIVEKAEYLEVFDLGSNGCILFNENGSKYFPNKRVGLLENVKLITRIEEHLLNQRALTIMYSYFTLDQQSSVYASNNLKVVNSWVRSNAKPKEKIGRIFLKL